MRTTHSADGTKIAFDQTGHGPPVILVVGAFNDRSTGAPLAKALEAGLTVLNYDRRGRGGSGDTQPYAVELYQTKLVGIPETVVAQLRHAPFRPALEAIAHTLVYDATLVGDLRVPKDRLRSINAPTLAIYGSESPALMGPAAKALAEAIPDGHVKRLDGQSHDIVPSALGPVLLEFFGR